VHEAFVDKPMTISGLLEVVSLMLFAHTAAFGRREGVNAGDVRFSALTLTEACGGATIS
jgi:hypothetical protein